MTRRRTSACGPWKRRTTASGWPSSTSSSAVPATSSARARPAWPICGWRGLTDVRLIESARREADLLFESDPELAQPEHQALRAQLQAGLGPGKGEIS